MTPLPPESTPSAAMPRQRFESMPFEPDGGFPLGGLAIASTVVAIAAVVLGMAVSYVHQWLYLVLIFPLLMGGLVGAVGAGGINAGKIRSPLVASLIGLAGGALVMLVSYYGDYRIFLRELAKQLPGVPNAPFEMSFFEFIDIRARIGVSIGKVGGGDKGLNLGYVGSYIYWGVEIACSAGIAFAVMRVPAAEPFCTGCQSWKTSHELGGLPIAGDATVALMQQGEIHRFLEVMSPTGPALAFKAHTCLSCGEHSTVEINVREVAVNAKGEQTETNLGTWTYPGESLPVWHQLFLQASVAADVPPESPPEAPA